ncbi:hypothetical protein F909_01126 [Acinetobacter sp. ANC 3929]|uniref:hypothetical protein n=1 Tax=unclassified Acinetobacter TaxID=196816 RepID=UPI0002D0D1D7|nr:MULTISPECIES: hypothetical protein [unclassified Acinetobacter]ENW82850.1 hypothetical protein F909_01126 [Acinetobacter sp. ANC 3929]MCH7355155.1 hypothetical protein [Acinetobacter sp. NIPH 1958]
MLKNKMTLRAMILVGISTSFSPSTFAAPLQILEFKKGQLSQSEQKQLCEQVKDFCTQQAKWQSLKTPDQALWLLSKGNIVQFNYSNSGFKLLKQWHIPLMPAEEVKRSGQYIFPKLFPMDQNRYAIAVIDTFSEMYSGGGAGIERASFYELKDSGKTHRFIENYPFSFNRMIRACFSEQDYESSKGKCHDEDGLSLDIRPIKPMVWQFRYRYSLDVSPASDSGEKSFKGSRNLNIDLNKAPEQPNIPAEWDYEGAG